MQNKKVFMTLPSGTNVYRLKLFNGLLKKRKATREPNFLARIELNEGLIGFTWSNGQGMAMIQPNAQDEADLRTWMFKNPVDSGTFDEWTEMTPPPKIKKHCLAV